MFPVLYFVRHNVSTLHLAHCVHMYVMAGYSLCLCTCLRLHVIPVKSKPFLFMLCFMFYGLYVSLFVPASLNFDPITWTSYSPDYVTGAYWCSKFTMEFQGPLPPSGTIMTHHVMSTLSSQPHIAAVLGEYSGCGFTILFRTLCQILSHMNHYVSCLFMQDRSDSFFLVFFKLNIKRKWNSSYSFFLSFFFVLVLAIHSDNFEYIYTTHPQDFVGGHSQT